MYDSAKQYLPNKGINIPKSEDLSSFFNRLNNTSFQALNGRAPFGIALEELEILNKIICLPVEDAFSSGFIYNSNGLDIDKWIQDHKFITINKSVYGYNYSLMQFLEDVRRYGSQSALIVDEKGTKDLSQPLKKAQIKGIAKITSMGNIQNIDTLSQDNLYTITLANNQTYQNVHQSRIINYYYENTFMKNNSYKRVFDSLYHQLAQYTALISYIEKALQTANRPVLYIDNLRESFTNEVYDTDNFKALIQSQIEEIAKGGNVDSLIYIDGKDKYEIATLNMEFLLTYYKFLMFEFSSCSGIPITRLYGKSPDGFNATGDSDSNNYNKLLQSIQNEYILPILGYFLEIEGYNGEVKAKSLNPKSDMDILQEQAQLLNNLNLAKMGGFINEQDGINKLKEVGFIR